MMRHGRAEALLTRGLESHSAVREQIGTEDWQVTGRWQSTRVKNSHQPFRRRERAMLQFRRIHTLQKFASAHGPNCDTQSVAATSAEIEHSGRCAVLMIEASHENLGKQPVNQPKVLADIGAQVAGGDRRIIGAMTESNLVGERQTLVPGQPLVYGQSITEGCIGWAMTEAVLELLAEAVVQRRIAVEAAVE